MSRIYPLFSSSKGNATYIGTKNEGILIDAGVTYKKLCEGLCCCGLSIENVKAVFVTHQHIDHIKGLNVLTKKQNIPVFAQNLTMNYLISSGMKNLIGEIINSDVSICGMKIKAFSTPHDTYESCGYRITTNDEKVCCVCTDLGHITDEVEENVMGADTVLLESNYDPEMLRTGSYPYLLKKRISSDNGHLSNLDSAIFARSLIQNGTKRIILGHLSQENNTPSLAESVFVNELSGFERNKDYILTVAPVETTGSFIAF